MLKPLSRKYPDLAFVDSEMDDGEGLVSAFIGRGRMSVWTPSSALYLAHLKRSARYWGLRDLDRMAEADENDEDSATIYCIICEVHDAMLEEGVKHRGKEVLRFLRESAARRLKRTGAKASGPR